MSGSEQETIGLLGFMRQVGFATSPQEEITIVEHSKELSANVKQTSGAQRGRRRNSSTCECSVEKENGI